ncbi:uncharacterized protein FOMMEDRAFT_67246, partial [Fomitiporia mediterranea MF3/22]|uniref:uncharacterized protein n=1 Tax=Fomitiporia mediterranea (strain MF3/22) TaxID=694068 RepID=UPI00044099E2
WEVYTKWKKTYMCEGDVIYLQAFSQSILVLNSISATCNLLEKKSNVFSDRLYLLVIYKMGFELLLPILYYGPHFRKYQCMFHQCFGPQAIKAFKPMQDCKLLKFLYNLLTKPDNFTMYVHNSVSGTILSVTYGHEVVTKNDPFVNLVEKA